MIRVGRSSIHGNGLFACIDIPRDTRIGEYIGKEMTLREFREQYGKDTRHTYSLRRLNRIIVGKGYNNPSHWCNESLNPNVCLKRRGLYTLRDIVAGEELFLKYPLDYQRDYELSEDT